MNDRDEDPFETQLRAQPLPALPEEWREEILSAGRMRGPDRSVIGRRLLAALAQWLWPHPAAYAALLAAWALVFGLRMATPDPELDMPAATQIAQGADPTQNEQALLLAGMQRQRELLWLSGNLEEGFP